MQQINIHFIGKVSDNQQVHFETTLFHASVDNVAIMFERERERTHCGTFVYGYLSARMHPCICESQRKFSGSWIAQLYLLRQVSLL